MKVVVTHYCGILLCIDVNKYLYILVLNKLSTIASENQSEAKVFLDCTKRQFRAMLLINRSTEIPLSRMY